MPLSWPSKDPDEVLDYSLNWLKRLDGDTISTSEWSVAAGDVAIDSIANDSTTSTVWLSGGTLGEVCGLMNRIVTAGNRTMEQTVKLRIRAK